VGSLSQLGGTWRSASATPHYKLRKESTLLVQGRSAAPVQALLTALPLNFASWDQRFLHMELLDVYQHFYWVPKDKCWGTSALSSGPDSPYLYKAE
jgi:hypothetical protein